MTRPTPDEPGAQLQADRVLGTLGRALERIDPVPTWVTDAARAALSWRTIDAELAELTFDSASAGSMAGMRAELTDRQMTFAAPGVEIEVMVVGDTRRLVGQLVPPQSAEVSLETDDGRAAGLADTLGRFSFEGVRPGRVRLSIRTAESRTVFTEWVLI
ncbi:MAG: hypothetical protein ACT4OP_07590 [Actinomycetota bacterium]